LATLKIIHYNLVPDYNIQPPHTHTPFKGSFLRTVIAAWNV